MTLLDIDKFDVYVQVCNLLLTTYRVAIVRERTESHGGDRDPLVGLTKKNPSISQGRGNRINLEVRQITNIDIQRYSRTKCSHLIIIQWYDMSENGSKLVNIESTKEAKDK